MGQKKGTTAAAKGKDPVQSDHDGDDAISIEMQIYLNFKFIRVYKSL